MSSAENMAEADQIRADIAESAMLAGCQGGVSIRGIDIGTGIRLNVTIGRHRIEDKTPNEVDAWLRDFGKRRLGKRGSRVWQWLSKQKRIRVTFDRIVTAMQVEHPKDYSCTHIAKAREAVEAEMRALYDLDMVEPSGHGGESPFKERTTQWVALKVESPKQRLQPKTRALVRDLGEVNKTLDMLRALAFACEDDYLATIYNQMLEGVKALQRNAESALSAMEVAA